MLCINRHCNIKIRNDDEHNHRAKRRQLRSERVLIIASCTFEFGRPYHLSAVSFWLILLACMVSVVALDGFELVLWSGLLSDICLACGGFDCFELFYAWGKRIHRSRRETAGRPLSEPPAACRGQSGGKKGDSPIAAWRGLYPRQGRYGCFKPSMIACSLRVDVAVCTFCSGLQTFVGPSTLFGGCSSYSDCSDGKQNVRKRKTNKPLLIRLCLTLQRVRARVMRKAIRAMGKSSQNKSSGN